MYYKEILFRFTLKRLTVLTLVFLFIFSSPGLLLAAENAANESTDTEEQPAQSDQANESESADSIDGGTSPLGREDGDPEYGDERKPAESKLRLDMDTLTGALLYTYPITVPPGRNGLQPDLKLIYNNSDSNNGNLFGYGWSINIPYIERINRKGVEKLYTVSQPVYDSETNPRPIGCIGLNKA